MYRFPKEKEYIAYDVSIIIWAFIWPFLNSANLII